MPSFKGMMGGWFGKKPDPKQQDTKPVDKPDASIPTPTPEQNAQYKVWAEEKKANGELLTRFFNEHKSKIKEACLNQDFRQILTWLHSYDFLRKPMQHPKYPDKEDGDIQKWLRQLMNVRFGEGMKLLNADDPMQKKIIGYFSYGNWNDIDRAEVKELLK